MLFSEIRDLADQVGAIEIIKEKLLNQPDKAAEKLAEALDEIYKMFKALDDEIVRYLGLSFDTQDSINEGRRVLLDMEGGKSKILMQETRGHCSKIANIYHLYLNGWFNRVFKHSKDREKMKEIFENLEKVDATIILAIDKVSFWLMKEAEQTLNSLDRGDTNTADSNIRRARYNVKEDREKLTEAMSQLRSMQADFIKSSKTVN